MHFANIGFYQVVDKDHKVLKQFAGLHQSDKTQANIEESYKTDGTEKQVVFSLTSSVAQPNKFFAPVPANDIVTIYSTLETGENNTPPSNASYMKIPANILELDRSNDPRDQLMEWNAFIGDQWVGTSEY